LVLSIYLLTSAAVLKREVIIGFEYLFTYVCSISEKGGNYWF